MSFSARTAARESSFMERRSGVFLSSASPVYETKTEGIVRVHPRSWKMRKAGEVGSQAV